MNGLSIKQKNEFASTSTLYIVATPIGNLRDITLRALDVLQNVEAILSEDTRITQKLLDRYSITSSCVHFDDFASPQQIQKYIEMLRNGDNIALVSDAGTPIISDPGYKFIELALQNNIRIEAIPGACSLINALVLSNLPPLPFMFIGFLPHGKKARDNLFRKYLPLTASLICFDSPKRILETLEILAAIVPTAKVSIAREMTKKFEEVIRGEATQVYHQLQQKSSIKGEIVLVINAENIPLTDVQDNIKAEIKQLLENKQSAKDISSYIAKKYNLSRKVAYSMVLYIL